MRHPHSALAALALICATTATGVAQETQAPPPPCTAPEHRQFDFWIGSWRVVDAEGRFQGTNRIETILDGCALQESWTGAGGSHGHSFNIYARGRARWHQTWVDARGMLLLLDGALVDGRMVLEGTTPSPSGATTVHRITWTPLSDGRVRQRWQTSSDGGSTWSDAFDGYYTRLDG